MGGNVNIEKGDSIIEIHLMEVLKKKLWLILLMGLIAAIAVYGYISLTVAPKYSSSVMLYVNNAPLSVGGTSISLSQGDITASRSLVSTLIVILQNSTVLDEVIEKTGVAYTYNQLQSMVSASAENSTEVLKITVTSGDPEEAAMLADTIAEILPLKISEIVEGTSTRLVAGARLKYGKISPNPIRDAVIAFVLAAFTCYAICLYLDAKDNTLKDTDRLRQIYDDIPYLGTVPDLTDEPRTKYGYASYSSKNMLGRTAKKQRDGTKHAN